MKIKAIMLGMMLFVSCPGFASDLKGIKVINIVERHADTYGRHGEGLISMSHDDPPVVVTEEQSKRIERILAGGKGPGRGKYFAKYLINAEYKGKPATISVNGHYFSFGFAYGVFKVKDDLEGVIRKIIENR